MTVTTYLGKIHLNMKMFYSVMSFNVFISFWHRKTGFRSVGYKSIETYFHHRIIKKKKRFFSELQVFISQFRIFILQFRHSSSTIQTFLLQIASLYFTIQNLNLATCNFISQNCEYISPNLELYLAIQTFFTELQDNCEINFQFWEKNKSYRDFITHKCKT